MLIIIKSKYLKIISKYIEYQIIMILINVKKGYSCIDKICYEF